MYAVVRTGGKQYKVSENEILRVETLPGEKGDAVEFKDLLMIAGDDGMKTGEALAGCVVNGVILHQGRAKKVLVFKKRRRKNYRRKIGHRQNYTELQITSIR